MRFYDDYKTHKETIKLVEVISSDNEAPNKWVMTSTYADDEYDRLNAFVYEAKVEGENENSESGLRAEYNEGTVITMTDSGFIRLYDRKGNLFIKGNLEGIQDGIKEEIFCFRQAELLMQCIQSLKQEQFFFLDSHNREQLRERCIEIDSKRKSDVYEHVVGPMAEGRTE